MITINNVQKLLLASILLSSSTILVAQDVPFADDGDPNFLFIGNSYTRQNDLAAVFDSIVKDGIPEWTDTANTNSASPPGRTLGAHLQGMENAAQNGDGAVADRILADALINEPDPWKWVVLQDQSQVPAFNDYDWDGTEFYRSRQAATKFNEYIAKTGGQTMFFMTWGRAGGDRNNPELFPDFLAMQEKLEEGYKIYRDETSTTERRTYIAPVGLVFRTIHLDALNADLDPLADDAFFKSLYTRDGSHPTLRGTYVAALTIYTSMFGKNPLDINFCPNGLEEFTCGLIKNAVSRTILETFESGEIEYAWIKAFPAAGTTSPPATAAPITQAPITASPVTTAPVTQPPATQAPTVASVPENNNKMGSVTITFHYDDYPEEISWGLLERDTGTPLYFLPYESNVAPNATVAKTFNNLEPGKEYVFHVIDSEGDGICCSYGEGSFTLYDEVQGRLLMYPRGQDFTYFETGFEILPNGHALVGYRSNQYGPGTWEDMEVMLAPTNETGWPGPFPTQPSNSLMINIDIDDNPQDLNWTLYRQNHTTREWTIVNTWDGMNANPGLDSTEFSNLESGWYHFVIHDSAQNGLCCDFGRGYLSITGPLASARCSMGLVWGNNGQFLAEEEIFFYVHHRSGCVSKIGYTEDDL